MLADEAELSSLLLSRFPLLFRFCDLYTRTVFIIVGFIASVAILYIGIRNHVGYRYSLYSHSMPFCLILRLHPISLFMHALRVEKSNGTDTVS
jgi:hypothetical protein